MKLGISDKGLRRIARRVASPPESLYHTTSRGGLQDIQETGLIKPKDYEGFVSFSAEPIELYDISGADYRIEVKMPEGVMPVEYDWKWAEKYPEHARYVAGEGWEEQFTYSEDTLDDEGWEDEDLMEEEWNDAMLNAFLDKSGEQEWISIKSGMDIPVEILNVEEL